MKEVKLWDELLKYVSNKYYKKELRESAKYLTDNIETTKNNKKIIVIFGNGGSAADAQHWAGELVCTYKSAKRGPFPAIALTTDTSIITAWSNDIGYEGIFARQIDAFREQIGIAIGLSTSGKSINVLNGLEEATKNRIKTVLISGSSVSKIKNIDKHIILPSKNTAIVQTMTQMLYHESCEMLEWREIPTNAKQYH